MYYPSLEEVRRLASRGNVVPVYREVIADLETPVSAYLKIAQGTGSFLLESVEGGERLARYSFLGTAPHLTVRMRGGRAELRRGERVETACFDNPLAVVRDELARFRPVEAPGLPRFHGGAVGYLGYECVRYFEQLPTPSDDPLELPEAILLFVDTLLVFDHLRHRIKVVGHAHVGEGDVDAAYAAAVDRIEAVVDRLRANRPLALVPGSATVFDPHGALPGLNGPTGGAALGDRGSFASNLTPEQFEAMVLRAKEYIYEGDVIQVVLSQRLSRPTRADPFSIYRALRAVNPSPYMYYLSLGDCHVVGASPEMLVRVEDGLVSTHPIAGTRRRGATPDEDLALEAELRADEKERAEHVMLLDLGRNDVGRVSAPGSVRATQVMEVERYSHVMHLVSHVTGRLRSDLSSYDALQACFPAGTVSGAPKIRAMEIIAELEPDRRGPYAGAVGYFGYGGNLDTAIAIRTMIVKDGVAHIQAGGGIVADSVPEAEYQESLSKARATLQATFLAEAGHFEGARAEAETVADSAVHPDARPSVPRPFRQAIPPRVADTREEDGDAAADR